MAGILRMKERPPALITRVEIRMPVLSAFQQRTIHQRHPVITRSANSIPPYRHGREIFCRRKGKEPHSPDEMG